MSDPQPGEVIFHAACHPALTAGDYQLHVHHTIQQGAQRVDTGSKPLPGERRFDFTLDAPRFTMDPSLIHAVFPPTNGVGSYVSRLPMIVLRRRTLPWEREMTAGTAQPWMAVLLFEKGEATTLSPCTVGDVLQGASEPQSPKLALNDVPAAVKALPCLGLEVPLPLFQQIAPMASEVPMLCHVRQVNTDDKELMGMDDDGWFAVVLGNRLPEPGRKYEACLVSLEGAEAFLPKPQDTPVLTAADLNRPKFEVFNETLALMKGALVVDDAAVSEDAVHAAIFEQMKASDSAWGWQANLAAGAANTGAVSGGAHSPNAPAGTASQHGVRQSAKASRWSEVDLAKGGKIKVKVQIPQVRLFMLAQWSFECREGGDFQAILQALPHNGGVAMLGMPPALAQAPDATTLTTWRAALDTGHVPLQHLTREGEQTLAWYRGPLTPVGVARETVGPYHSADQARRIDPATGLENLGYASAFEIGRLLALSDTRFALDLLNWRRSSRLLLDRRVLGSVLQAHLGLHPALPELALVQATVLPRILTTFASTRFDGLMQTGKLGTLRDPTGLRDLQAHLAGLDSEVVADAKGLQIEVVKTLMDGLLVGGSSVLEAVGFAELAPLETDLDTLAANPALHFAPQLQVFDQQLRSFQLPQRL